MSLFSSPAEVLEQKRQGRLGQRAQDGGESDVHGHPSSERQHHLLCVSEGVQHGGIGAAQRHRQRHHQKATQVSADSGPGPGLLQSQVNNVRNVCPCSTESGAHQSDVEHVQLQDHPELGAGQSPGERVRGHRLQSEHPKIVFGIFEWMPASIADTDTDTFYLSHDRHD